MSASYHCRICKRRFKDAKGTYPKTRVCSRRCRDSLIVLRKTWKDPMGNSDRWVWREAEIITMGDLMKAIQSVQTREDADALVTAYSAINENAPDNIGYMLGYLGAEERERVARLFTQCSHPVFGHNFGRGATPTAEAAFEAGLARGQAMKEQGDE